MDTSSKMRPMTAWTITEHTGVSLSSMLNKKYTFVAYIFSVVSKLKANMNKFNSASLPREADFSLFCREVKLGTKGQDFQRYWSAWRWRNAFWDLQKCLCRVGTCLPLRSVFCICSTDANLTAGSVRTIFAEGKSTAHNREQRQDPCSAFLLT